MIAFRGAAADVLSRQPGAWRSVTLQRISVTVFGAAAVVAGVFVLVGLVV